MRLRNVLALTSAAALTVVTALASPALAGDIIVLKSGRMVGNAKASNPPSPGDYAESNFEIDEENLDKVVYRIAGVPTPQTIKFDDVDTIYHDPDLVPLDLAQGKEQLRQRQYENALDSFTKAAKDASAPKWAQAEAAVRAADALYDLGDLEGATKAYDAFVKTHSQSRWVPHATEHLARIKLDRGDIAGARAGFEALKGMRGLPENQRYEVEYWIVWIDEQVAQQKNDTGALEKARKGYEGLITTIRGRSGLAELQGKCEVGKASCVVGAGRHAEAEQLLEKLIKDHTSPTVRAAAYTLLGRVIVLQNTGTNDRAKYKTALLHFLRVVTLYGDAPGADPYLAEALFRSGELFNELRPANPTSEEEKQESTMARLRARREWQECMQRFPNSPWAQKARAAMSQ